MLYVNAYETCYTKLNMDVSFIETKTIEELKSCLTKMEDDLLHLKNNAALSIKQQVYTNQDIIKLLKINTSTLKKYRDEGMLGFSQVLSKYYYTSDDVAQFLRMTHIEPFYWD